MTAIFGKWTVVSAYLWVGKQVIVYAEPRLMAAHCLGSCQEQSIEAAHYAVGKEARFA